MSQDVLIVEHLSKEYVRPRTAQEDRYETFQTAMLNGIKNIFIPRKNTEETFFALKDVSFKLEEGDRLALIGQNGSGKSTLLKILTQITTASSGRFALSGRVASLLEVGTGFHGELSGRENIYLNGAILGMDSGEIKKHFDEIVEFSEVSEFLDLPVKRYSSGMYMKLAFSIAAHLNAELLFIDEVLAVGDVRFQEKCLSKMSELSRSGRTVIFVSHNMASIQQLCNKAIWLDRGQSKMYGNSSQVISAYLKAHQTVNIESESQYPVIPVNLSIQGPDKGSHPEIGKSAEISLTLLPKRDQKAQVAIIISDQTGSDLAWLYDFQHEFSFKEGIAKSFCFSVPQLNLYPGNYWLGARVTAPGLVNTFYFNRHILNFDVKDNPAVAYFPSFDAGKVKTFVPFTLSEQST